MTGRPDTLTARILSGIAWKAGSQVTLQVARMIVALFLARMLTPHDWGLAAMVLVFAGFVVVFTDSALATALIQRREISEDDRSTVFFFGLGIGVVLAATGIACSGLLASFYGEPEVRSLFVAVSIGFLVSAVGATHMALLVREMEFKRLELRQIAATVVGAGTGIGLAVAGAGAWAIVGQLLGEAVTSTVLLWILTPWRPQLRFAVASLRKLGAFAGNVFAENVLWQAARALVSILIGRVLGAAALGTYTLATTVILMPFVRIAAPLQQVFFPAFSRMADDRERMADVWIRATRMVGAISVPALVGLAVVTPEFVALVLGDRWEGATDVIRILAIVGIVQSLQTLHAEVLLALGRSGTLARFTLLWFAGSIGAVAIGTHWGLKGAATGYAVATLLIEPVRAFLTTSALGIPLRRFVVSLSGIAQAAALMAASLLAGAAALHAVGAPAAVRLPLLAAFGALVYIAAARWRAPEVAAEVRGVAARRRRLQPHAEAISGREPRGVEV